MLFSSPRAADNSTKPTKSPAAVTPKFARGSLPGSVISLDDDEDEEDSVSRKPFKSLASTSSRKPAETSKSPNTTPSQSRALAKLQSLGKSIQKSDPNKMASGLSARARERIEGMGLRKQTGEKADPTTEAKARVCNLQDDAELQALLNECSQHEDLVKLNDIDYMDGYFKRAAAKEGLEEAIENTKEVECAVVTCKQVGTGVFLLFSNFLCGFFVYLNFCVLNHV